MAWITDDGTGLTLNQRHMTNSLSVFVLKALLKAAGWTVQSSSDGTVYNAAGDQITLPGSGAGGMNNNYAWFRLRDPGGRREVIFQRYVGDTFWIVVYSALARFVGGAPNATTRPTATDEAGVLNGVTAIASAVSLFPSTSYPWTFWAAAQTTPQNGNVYSFWCVASSQNNTDAGTVIAMEAVRTKSNDPDPCVCLAGDGVAAATLRASSTDAFYGWLDYGLSTAQWTVFPIEQVMQDSAYGDSGFGVNRGNYQGMPSTWTRYSPWQTPYLGQFAPTSVGRGIKGSLYNLRWVSNNNYFTALQVAFDGMNRFLCVPHLAFPGWPVGVVPLVG